MSADSDISALLTHATNAAESLASSASNLIGNAVAAIGQSIEFAEGNSAAPQEMGLSNQGGPFDGYGEYFKRSVEGSAYLTGETPFDGFGEFFNRENINNEPPPAFPVLPVVDLGIPPRTQKLDEVELDIENLRFPTLSFPSFIYPNVAGVPKFNKTLPVYTESDIGFPEAPNEETVFTPTFLDVADVNKEDINQPEFPTLLAPTSANIIDLDTVYKNALGLFNQSIFTGVNGLPGLDVLLQEVSTKARQTLDTLLPAALDVLSNRMNNKYSAVLAFQDDLQERLEERLKNEKDRVITTLEDQSGWDLPQAIQLARRAFVDQLADSWAAQADSKVSTKTKELSLEFFETCSSILSQFVLGAQKLLALEVTTLLEAHKSALVYAKATLVTLLAVYDANYLVQELAIKTDEARLKLFEQELSIALFQYEIAKIELEVEGAKQENDSARINVLKSNVVREKNLVRRYAALSAAARKEVEYRGFAVEQFELAVKAYGAKIEAHEAEVEAQIAEIEGDATRVEGQLKKLEGFESQMRGFLQLIETKKLRADAQSIRNNAVIEEYEQRVKSALAEIDQSVIQNTHTLKEYEVQVNNLLADAKLGRKAAKLELDFRNKELNGEIDAYELTQERNIKLMEVELSRLKAIADVNSHGAGIMASMSQGAMSAANGIAAAVFSETA